MSPFISEIGPFEKKLFLFVYINDPNYVVLLDI